MMVFQKPVLSTTKQRSAYMHKYSKTNIHAIVVTKILVSGLEIYCEQRLELLM